MKRIDALRPIIFKIALGISLGVAIVLLNFGAGAIADYNTAEVPVEDEMPEIVRTAQVKPKVKVPPPQKPDLQKIETVKDLVDNRDSVVVLDSIVHVDTTAVVVDSVWSEVPEPPVIVEPYVENDEPIHFPDKMPVFGDCYGLNDEEMQTCSYRQLLEFIKKELKYPPLARQAGIEGRVVLRFVVGKNGEIGDVEILRDIGAGCGAEAVRVVNKMPNWSPGVQRGKPVPVIYTLPVSFRLQ